MADTMNYECEKNGAFENEDLEGKITAKLEKKIRDVPILFVGGRFDREGGRSSKIAAQIADAIRLAGVQPYEYRNGGTVADLADIVDGIARYNMIFWLADVPNDEEKVVRDIKKRNCTCLLTTSKRNVEKKYAFEDSVYHALSIKSNLVVEFSKLGERYVGRIFDPLGNVFLDYTENFDLVGRTLAKRCKELFSCTRVPSERIGDALVVPDEQEFFTLIRGYADTFHTLLHVHPDATNRFLGNASFRCERGFPSFRNGELIFVSRRNIDKRFIDKDGFVGVRQVPQVNYFGDQKPSVDTPIQVKLYDYYTNVRYMLHAHAYVQGAPMTSRILPCGAIEEFEEITALFASRDLERFAVNVKGHGSIVFGSTPNDFKNISYVARKLPEIWPDYAK